MNVKYYDLKTCRDIIQGCLNADGYPNKISMIRALRDAYRDGVEHGRDDKDGQFVEDMQQLEQRIDCLERQNERLIGQIAGMREALTILKG